MASFEIKVKRLPRLAERFIVPGGGMARIGRIIIAENRARTARAVNAFDQPTLPLTKKYVRRKELKGKKPQRDLRLTGELMAAFEVKAAQDNRVAVGWHSGRNIIKVRTNQLRDPMIGISESDSAAVNQAVQEEIRSAARGIFA